MAEEVGVGYVRLVPSARGFAKEAAKQLKSGLAGPSRDAGKEAGDAIGKEGQPAGDKFVAGFSSGVEKGAKSKLRSLGKLFSGVSFDVDDKAFGRWMGKLFSGASSVISATAKPLAASAAAAFVVPFIGQVVAGLASGASKIGAGLGASLALLPAIALTAATAFAAVKIAVSGVGDALKAGLSGDTEKFNESLKGLSPSARAFAKDVAGLRDELGELKRSVQEKFFKPFADSVEPLAARYLPMLQGTLGNVANMFGRVVDQVGNLLLLPETGLKIAGAFGNVDKALSNLVPGLSALFQAFLPLVTVGATFLPGLSSGFTGAAVNLAGFMQEAERTGKLREFISSGLSAIGELIDKGATLVSVFQNIGSIGRTVFDAIGLKSGNILGTVDRLTAGFDRWLKSAEGTKVLGTVLEVARTALGGFWDNASKVATLAGKVLGPLVPHALRLFKALVKLKAAVLDVALEALTPIIMGIGSALGFLLPQLASFAEWLARNKPVLQGIGIAITALLVPAFVAWAISAGAAAVATLLAMAPIILLGIAIAALAALVIIHFDTIKRWISNVWNWVKDNWPKLLAILTGPIGLAVVLITSHWDKIKAGVTAVKDWIVARFNDVVGFVRGLPGRITSAVSGMWDGIKSSFKSVINTIIGWWNGISFKLPTIRIPGFDPPGPGSFGGATIGGQTFSTPNIPTLHDGGIFRTSDPSGEGLALLKDQEAVLSPERTSALLDSPAATAAPVRLVVDTGNGVDELARLLVKWLRVNPGARLGGAR